MKTILAGIAVVCLAVAAGAGQQKSAGDKGKDPRFPEGYTIPEKDAQAANPVKPTDASIAAGGKFYSSQCAMCHGKDGDGKGDLAEQMGIKMPDCRKPETLAKFSDGELFYILTNGMGKMPAEGDRTPDEKKWNVINYMRSLSKPKEGGTPAPKP
ncbi:MAG TPA: cytochrome c [Candidatus Acidoferrales bacterium]|nr:cytochrome c [Candidatus Acidoferrales bacterium]